MTLRSLWLGVSIYPRYVDKIDIFINQCSYYKSNTNVINIGVELRNFCCAREIKSSHNKCIRFLQEMQKQLNVQPE